jgi:hypothetical protein
MPLIEGYSTYDYPPLIQAVEDDKKQKDTSKNCMQLAKKMLPLVLEAAIQLSKDTGVLHIDLHPGIFYPVVNPQPPNC